MAKVPFLREEFRHVPNQEVHRMTVSFVRRKQFCPQIKKTFHEISYWGVIKILQPNFRQNQTMVKDISHKEMYMFLLAFRRNSLNNVCKKKKPNKSRAKAVERNKTRVLFIL